MVLPELQQTADHDNNEAPESTLSPCPEGPEGLQKAGAQGPAPHPPPTPAAKQVRAPQPWKSPAHTSLLGQLLLGPGAGGSGQWPPRGF